MNQKSFESYQAPAHAPDWQLLHDVARFRKASALKSTWQVLNTLFFLAACFILVRAYPFWWTRLLLILPVAGLLMRLFVLQHDCGHHAFYNSRRANHLCGYFLSFITTVPFRLWAAEHQWHHNHQGKLEYRGVDMMNSPMTTTEAAERPDHAALRRARISALNIFLIGAWSLLVERKFLRDFFMFREKFRWKIPREAMLRRSLYIAHAGSLLCHGLILSGIGWQNGLLLVLPASIVAAGFGSLLFWVQHNFEGGYHATLDQWRYDQVALRGSSYLRLPWLLNWFSASIGLHHVHHLSYGIPNYRLEEARLAVPALCDVKPLKLKQLKYSFSKVFWDQDASRMSAQ